MKMTFFYYGAAIFFLVVTAMTIMIMINTMQPAEMPAMAPPDKPGPDGLGLGGRTLPHFALHSASDGNASLGEVAATHEFPVHVYFPSR